MSKIQEIKQQIEALQSEIKSIQTKCKHPDKYLFWSYGSNTGNWCASDDCYWKDLYCEKCDKKWRVYSEEDREAYLNNRGTRIK